MDAEGQPVAGVENRCGPPERAARPKVDGKAGSREWHLPRARGTFQAVLRGDHSPGHSEHARARFATFARQEGHLLKHSSLLDAI